MQSEHLTGEIAGLIARLSTRVRTDPKYASVLNRDTEDNSVELALAGLEDAIAGLVMLHIQMRRRDTR